VERVEIPVSTETVHRLALAAVVVEVSSLAAGLTLIMDFREDRHFSWEALAPCLQLLIFHHTSRAALVAAQQQIMLDLVIYKVATAVAIVAVAAMALPFGKPELPVDLLTQVLIKLIPRVLIQVTA
jgi:hypothetical protein